MKEEIRKYTTEAGSVYTQTRHYDEKEDFVGEFWERQSDNRRQLIDFAAYVSDETVRHIAKQYVKYKNEKKFSTNELRKLINFGKREHYKGKAGVIIYLFQSVTIYVSTTVEQIEPAFEQ